MKKTELLKQHAPGYVLFALLILFVGSFAIQNHILGSTLASAFMPVKADSNSRFSVDDTQQISVKEVRESQPEYFDLVETIRQNPQKIPALPPSKIDLESIILHLLGNQAAGGDGARCVGHPQSG